MRKKASFSPIVIAAVALAAFSAGTLASRRLPTISAAAAPAAQAAKPPAADGKLRIIFFGAHPDDAEYRGAGVAVKWAAAGHHVKFVSTTNGDIGHWGQAGGPLAMRRTKEVQEVARKMGVTVEVLDIHDGEIMPTLENRRTITRLIREWNADVVITNRPNDYHPDHRYTSILVQDSAFMVTVPFFTPDVKPLSRNPVFLYSPDRFQRPNPFRADVAVAIDEVMDKTLDALLEMESQIHEGGAGGHEGIYPASEPGRSQRREQVRKNLAARYAGQANTYRAALTEFYGEQRAKQVRYAQAFEVCEYGRQPGKEELRKLFPF
ncbi:MAG: PIG-L family deacetylase [Acidimicrobiia bacterium]|nr:PIG-L family deacetylase [Acidimicrobiia bacterium]